MKSILVGMKNVLLWSYARGSWQFDLLCLLIVTTIFLIPSRYFGDRDRSLRAKDTAVAASKAASQTIQIEASELLDFLQRESRNDLALFPHEALPLYLRDRLARSVTVVDYEPIESANAPAGYRVWYK